MSLVVCKPVVFANKMVAIHDCSDGIPFCRISLEELMRWRERFVDLCDAELDLEDQCLALAEGTRRVGEGLSSC